MFDVEKRRTELIETKQTIHAVLNEHGTAVITNNVQIQNKSDQPEKLPLHGIMETASDMVDIRTTDSNGKLLHHRKLVKADEIWTYVDLSHITLDPNEEYAFTIKYTVPSLAKRFDNTYFVRIFQSYTPHSTSETFEIAHICELPKLFGKYEFWKEMYVNAPMASRVYTQNGVKKVEHHCVLPRGSHREFSFMFQERYNSKIVALLSFLLGVGLVQFLEWLIGLLF